MEAELELRVREQAWTEPLRLETIYLGGGTPSLLGAGAVAGLAKAVARFATWDACRIEWTAEANPESFTAEVAADWCEHGVNRVSFGAQTFHEPTLRWMGRLHGPDGPGRAMALARAAGIENISVDLIFGLPSRLGRDWSADLDRVLELEPAHVSLYGLTAEPATPLGRRVAEGKEALADEDRYTAEFLEAAERLAAAGFRQYEVSNFARQGRESRHNQAYWEHRPYLGLGPGAHSFLPPHRFWNTRDWTEYRHRLETGMNPEVGREQLGPEELDLERIWLGLRVDMGMALAELGAAQLDTVRRWSDAGWANLANGRVRLTPAGWLLLDRLAVELAAQSG
jgi:oxygen-independent coproporphyrinogen-3 oxidase